MARVEQEFIPLADAAIAYGKCQMTIKRWCESGDLRYFYIQEKKARKRTMYVESPTAKYNRLNAG